MYKTLINGESLIKRSKSAFPVKGMQATHEHDTQTRFLDPVTLTLTLTR